MSAPRHTSGWSLSHAAAFLVGLAAAALALPALSVPVAAQVPDSGAQRNAMIVELQKSNQRLTEILDVLRQIRDRQAAPHQPPGGRGRP